MDPQRPIPPEPDATGRERGLAWARFDPPGPPRGGVVILHGAGSRKENHFHIGREMSAAGLSAICFDQRGHGGSNGPMDGRIVDDAVTIASLFEGLPLGLRGSSMGGWVALAAASPSGASALVAICPTTAAQLSIGLETGFLDFDADRPAVLEVLAAGDPPPPSVPTLLLHASGDEVVPVERSRALASQLEPAASRFVEVEGGHHRSLQHDPAMTSLSISFLADQLGG